MKINRENYPLFFLDYFEGSLPRAAEAELFDFLENHPDLRQEFDAFTPVSLPSDEPVSFPGRESLKRGVITRHNYEWYFAAYAEGDLDAATHAAVDSFCAANPEMAAELALFQKVFLDGSDKISYDDKASLKRAVVMPLPAIAETAGRSIAMTVFWRYASVAAVILLMAGFFFLRMPHQPGHLPGNEHAQNIDKAVAKGRDDPEAVAEVPSRQRDTANLSPRTNDLPVQAQAQSQAQLLSQSQSHSHSHSQSQSQSQSQLQLQTQTPAQTPAQAQTQTPDISSRRPSTSVPASGIADRGLTEPSYERFPAGPTGMLASIQPSIRSGQLSGLRKPDGTIYDHRGQMAATVLDYRTEFAYWTTQSLPNMLDEPAVYTEASNMSGQQLLAQRGLERIQRNSGVDFSKVEARIAENRFPLWELASLGITQLGTMAGNAIGLQTRTDEDGQIVQLSLGERFEARRSR